MKLLKVSYDDETIESSAKISGLRLLEGYDKVILNSIS